MGDTGPNGPCSGCTITLATSTRLRSSLNSDDDVDERFLELWNLVFMQYGTDENGVTTPLPAPSIDTGISLERLARIVQGGANNYATDLFMPAMDRVQELLNDDDAIREANTVGYRVIADHGRAATFLIGDGVIPGNSGAPYVLRMIIRRAARFGRKIGFTQPFLADIAQVYIDHMGGAYPEIRQRADFIKRTLSQEEVRFAQTLDRAQQEFDKIAAELRASDETVIPGKLAFRLHDTNGLPLEITRDLAKEIGFTVDEAGFAAAREAHAIASGKGAFGQYDISEQLYGAALDALIENGTLGPDGVTYDPYQGARLTAPIVGLFQNGQIVDSAETGTVVEVVTTATPFYVEAGGEVSDTGTIRTESGSVAVTGMRRRGGLVLHSGEVVSGSVCAGESAELQVDDPRRHNIRRNHTATHLLHEVLRRHLGTHVTQQGSLVAPDRLRFDFSHGEALRSEELAAIEADINAAVLANYGVSAELMAKDDAIARGAMALFGEKYGEIVRTIQIDDGGAFSFELCGGLHVGSTGEIGAFHFTSESSAAAGIRRVEAVTGPAAQAFVAEQLTTLHQAARKLNTTPAEVSERIDALLNDNRQLQKHIEQLQRSMAKAQFDNLLRSADVIDGVTLLVGKVDNVTADGLREMTDWFRNRAASGVVVLGTVSSDKPLFIAAVTDDVIKRGVRAGDLVREMGKLTGGGGGGRPNLAQAGGRDAAKLASALQQVPELVRTALAKA